MTPRTVSRPDSRRRRSGFTIPELLVVILIIVILAGVALAALGAVQQEAREQRARTQIMHLNALLMTRWESYRTRPVPVRVPPGSSPQNAAVLRLNAIRELMRTEMPDRISDVMDGTVVLPNPPALQLGYRRRATLPGVSWTAQFQGAECLYLIIGAIRVGDKTGLDHFQTSEIGDVDGDGMPEILDPWGNPIEFLRWAPAVRSPLQDGDPVESHDPFDPLQSDANAFALHPLVYSAGPDKLYDVVTDYPAPDGPLRYATTVPPNYPYYTPPSGPQIGTAMDANGDGRLSYSDNIHNHLLAE